MVLIDSKGRSTADKLYAFDTQMDFQTAYAIASAQNVSLAPMQAAYLGLGLLTFHNPKKLIPEVRWMRSKGRGRMGRFAFAGKLPKPQWYDPSQGAGSAVQDFNPGDAFFANDVTGEVYIINEKAQLQWALANTGRTLSQNDLPMLSEVDMGDFILESFDDEKSAKVFAETTALQQCRELGLFM